MAEKEIIDDDALKKHFDNYILLVRTLEDDAVQTALKLGATSKVVIKKMEQIEQLKKFYSLCTGYIERQRTVMQKMAINYRAMEIIVMHKETGLPYEKVARALGMSIDEQNDFKKVDNAEPLFREVMKEIAALDNIKFNEQG